MPGRGLKSYHFDLGDSSRGPIGYCARVQATSKRAAVDTLKEAIDSINSEVNAITDHEDGIEYLEVYLNAYAITVKDIDEWEWAND